VGYLLVAGSENFTVRLAAAQGRFRYEDLKATGPLYESYADMERANTLLDPERTPCSIPRDQPLCPTCEKFALADTDKSKTVPSR
jgi:hypothetical protein